MDDVKIKFEKGVLDFIVEKAMEFKLGARGLRSICEANMVDLMFDTPSDDKVKEISLSLSYAKGKLSKSAMNKLKVAQKNYKVMLSKKVESALNKQILLD